MEENYTPHMGGDGGCRVGEVRAGTTSPMPDQRPTNPHEVQTYDQIMNSTFHIREMLVFTTEPLGTSKQITLTSGVHWYVLVQ